MQKILIDRLDEIWERAKLVAKFPFLDVRKKLTNENILIQLRKVGVATQSDVDDLTKRLNRLEVALQTRSKATSDQPSFLQPRPSEVEN